MTRDFSVAQNSVDKFLFSLCSFTYLKRNMLTWSTQFPILPNHSIVDLLDVAKTWITGSPHWEWTREEILDAEEGTVRVTCKGEPQSCIEIGKVLGESEEHCGFRYHRLDKSGQSWITEICGHRTPDRFLVGIHLHSSTSVTGMTLTKAKKPYIVRLLLNTFGGDVDADLHVSDKPRRLGEAEVDLASRLLLGESRHQLPVVYVSSTWDDRLVVNATRLAWNLGGMAHVVTEPSRHFSYILADRVDRINPYGGAVAICWPNSGGRMTRLVPGHFKTEGEFISGIEDTVREALVGTRPNHNCTWNYLMQLVVRRRIKVLREAGKADLNDYMLEFDHELELAKKRHEEAEQEISRLKSQLLQRSRSEEFYSHGILKLGVERDLFAGEHRDVIAYALKTALMHIQPDGRVRDILNALVASNPASGESERLEIGIRNALKSTNDLGPRERKKLHELGFSLSEDGKHLKLQFRGDDRYTFIMPKTGSDHRGMKNWISDTCKRLFK